MRLELELDAVAAARGDGNIEVADLKKGRRVVLPS